jgi:hypothetical protein
MLLAAALAAAIAGCKPTTLGPPDSFLVLAPREPVAGQAQRSQAGLPVLEALPLDDTRVVALHKQLVAGFPGEVLRSDYLAKQLARDGSFDSHRFPDAARAAAVHPTALVLGSLGPAPLGTGIAVKSFWGGTTEWPDVGWVALERDPERDTALPQTLAGLLARQVVLRVVGPAAPPVLLDGYARAMEVVAREWRVGEGPAGSVQPDAGTSAQRALFAGVRENQFAVGPDDAPRPAAELLADPGVAATVIYRLAQSKAVGRKVAPAEVYAPFVTDRVPPGVSPAAVLGPFRNFQAKLLAAWGRAALAGTPPQDIAELVEAYGRAMPAERAEALRIFVVTTYGATVKPGGVRGAGADAAKALPELTALAAEVAAGKRSSREALGRPPPR